MRKDCGLHRHHLWVLCLCLAATLTCTAIYYRAIRRDTSQRIERIQTLYADRTENLVNSIFHKTDVLAAVVKLNHGDISEETFDDIARIVYTPDSGIRGIQYMPGAVVTYSYPVEGNEAVIGKNFLEIPERRNDVLLAINTKSIALSGPYHLIQGGLGVVARNPIFLKDESGNDRFWGFSAIILDLPDALDAAGLDHLSESGYDFQLYCINENQERIVISGNEKLNLAGAVSSEIQVPHHEWTLAVAELNPWNDMMKAGFLLLIGTLLSVVLWRLYDTIGRERIAVQAKDRFFANISHDMRTPLNAVIGFSSLAQMPDVTPEQKDDYLRKIQSSGRLLLDLVNDTLTISKTAKGKMQLSLSPAEINDLTAPIITEIREMAADKKIFFTADESLCRPRTVMVDALNVRKILLNLLNNAVKYTPEGGQVSLTAADSAEQEGIIYTVRDTGIGISPEFIPHLYEPFAQERRRGYESMGTGLGLAIVHDLVELMHGTIQVESRVGGGTCFTVFLPLAETKAQQPQAPAAEKPDLSLLKDGKVLLVEDNEINRQIAGMMLENMGMHADQAVNGREGLERFEASAPGTYIAILMDLRMPVMDGYESVSRIRRLNRPDAASVPIIAMTADVFAEDIRRCREAGMDDHVAKPVDAILLQQALLRQIKKAGQLS